MFISNVVWHGRQDVADRRTVTVKSQLDIAKKLVILDYSSRGHHSVQRSTPHQTAHARPAVKDPAPSNAGPQPQLNAHHCDEKSRKSDTETEK